MPINPKVIAAASIASDPITEDTETKRARRVLLSQAECVSDGMVADAIEAYRQYISKYGDAHHTAAWSHAIAAALRHEAEK